MSSRYAALLVILALVLPGCQSKEERVAGLLLQSAEDVELRSGLDAAMVDYREIVTSYPTTKAAETAREKLRQYRQKIEERAMALYEQAQGKSEDQAAAIHRQISEKYPDTEAAKRAEVELQAYAEAQRLAAEREARRLKEQQALLQGQEETARQREAVEESAKTSFKLVIGNAKIASTKSNGWDWDSGMLSSETTAPDTYVGIFIQGGLVHQTGVRKDSFEPAWDDSFVFWASSHDEIRIRVFDSDATEHDLVGSWVGGIEKLLENAGGLRFGAVEMLTIELTEQP